MSSCFWGFGEPSIFFDASVFCKTLAFLFEGFCEPSDAAGLLSLSSARNGVLVVSSSVSSSSFESYSVFLFVALACHSNLICQFFTFIPAGIYLFKVNNRNTRTMCGIYSKLTIKTTDFAHCSGVSIVDFEQVNANTKIIQVLFLFKC